MSELIRDYFDDFVKVWGIIDDGLLVKNVFAKIILTETE